MYRTRNINNRGYYYFFHIVIPWCFFDVRWYLFDVVRLLNVWGYYYWAGIIVAGTVCSHFILGIKGSKIFAKECRLVCKNV